MHDRNETFELLHYIASWILLCASCVDNKALIELIISFTILEKYGFVVLLLIVLQGTAHYAKLAWGALGQIVKFFRGVRG